MTDSAPSPQPLPGLLARVVGVLTSPKATFERIVQTPKVLGILLLLGLTTGIGQSAFTFTQAGQQAFVDAAAQQIERFSGNAPTDEQIARLEKQAPYQSYISLVGSLIGLPIVAAVEAGIFFLVFNVILGGTATFKQVYAVVLYAAVVSVVGVLVGLPVQFARGAISITGPANLGALFPMLAENSLLSSFLGLIDVFRLWWVVVMSIGLGVLYRRRTFGIALTLLGVYLAIALGISLIFHGR